MIHQPFPVTSVILSGGLGTRIGGEKGLQPLHGLPLISWVLAAVSADSAEVLINANGAPNAYTQFGKTVIADQFPDWPGPLAGLQAALMSARMDYVMTVPCDTPFLPDNLLTRLFEALQLGAQEAAVAVVGGRRQPTIALYRKSVLPKLDVFLREGKRKVNDWLDTLSLVEVTFEQLADFDNINTLEDLARAGKISAKIRLDSLTGLSPHGKGDQ